MKAVIIGTGAGSIASALRLRALGLAVDVFEACPDAGGRARTLTFHGHSFDAGPTVITAPWLFDELFELFGEDRRAAIEFLPCDPWYRLLFADGEQLDLVPSIERQEAEIARISPSDALNYRAYLQHCQRLYSVGYEQLGTADFSSLSSMLKMIPQLMQLRGMTTLWRYTASYFTDRRVRQAFSLPPLLVGGNPLTTTAIYGLIHAMERKGGIWFAKGGTSQLISQLIALATRHGVRFHYNHPIHSIVTNASGQVTAIEASQQGESIRIPCDLAVWGGDPRTLYNTLGPQRLSLIERLRERTVTSSMGLYVLYFKTKRNYPSVAHHTIVLSPRWEGLLKDIFSGTGLPSDPSLYLHRPAATDTTLSQSESDLFYVLAPVPHLGNYQSWERDEPRFRQTVLEILANRALPGLLENLVFAESVDPRYFRDTLMSPLGAGFSIAPTLSQSAWGRFHNRMDKITNLYLCGAGVHPGGGLPGVVTSAKVVERLVQNALSIGGRDNSKALNPSKTEAAA
ncbi:MAG: phytoene desaturase family protein [Pseudomonadota bacterium]|jgi:phytoene desaturase